ncbi:hypothetical protein ACSBR1_033321 [Camellia fascicularis]
MIELAIALHSKGFSITIAHTLFNSSNLSNHLHLTFHPMPDGLTDRDTSSGDFPTFVPTINTNCEAPIKECLAQMMNQEERMRNEVACIIYDTLMHATETVTNHLKIPTIVLRTTGASIMVVYGCMTRLYEASYFPLEGPSPRTPSPEVQRPTHLQHHHQIPFFPIGPLFKISSPSLSTSLLEENINYISWLDKQAPNCVLYISLGSLASVNETELVEMAWGLANSGQTFLWVIRLDSVHGFEWMELLPEGFDDVIAGVPMICSPGFGDQKVNARYVSGVWKMGLELVGDGLERGKIERVVRRLMGGEEGEEMRQRATDLKKKVESLSTSCTGKNKTSERQKSNDTNIKGWFEMF